MSKKSRRFGWLLIAAILLAFPVYAILTWVATSRGGLSQADNLARYLEHFPNFFQSKSSVTWVALMLNITANALTIGTAVSKRTRTNWLSIILLAIGVLMMLWLGLTLL